MSRLDHYSQRYQTSISPRMFIFSSGSQRKLCSFWNLNTKLVYHSVWIRMYNTYKFTDKATGCLQSWYPFMIFLQRQINIKTFVLSRHVIQDTMCITNMVLYVTFYGSHLSLFISALYLNIVILDISTVCLRHYVSDIYLYHYIQCKVIQSRMTL